MIYRRCVKSEGLAMDAAAMFSDSEEYVSFSEGCSQHVFCFS